MKQQIKNNVGADMNEGENKASDYLVRRNDFVLGSDEMCFQNAELFICVFPSVRVFKWFHYSMWL